MKNEKNQEEVKNPPAFANNSEEEIIDIDDDMDSTNA